MTRTHALFAAALGLLLAAMAVPRRPGTAEDPSPVGVPSPVALAVLVDRSASMGGGRLDGARSAMAETLASLRPSDRFALLSFAEDARVDLPLARAGHNRPRADTAVSRMIPAGPTRLAAGLAAGLRELHRAPEGSTRRIVVLTDPATARTRDDVRVTGALTRLAAERGVEIELRSVPRSGPSAARAPTPDMWVRVRP